MRRLANFLARHGALVFIVKLPDAEDGSKQGADDYVARYGAEAFAQLVEDAEPWGSIGMVKHLQAELRALKRQLAEQAALLRNPAMRERDKLVALATINEAGWRTSTGTPAPFVVNRERIAGAVGLKADAVGQSLKRLCDEGGLFVKQVTRATGEDGQPRSVIKLTPRYADVGELRREAAHFAPRYTGERGGRRYACPDHPDAELIKQVTVVCAECGQVVQDSRSTLKPQDDVSAAGAGDSAVDPSAAEGLNRQDDVSADAHLSAARARVDTPVECAQERQADAAGTGYPAEAPSPTLRTSVPQLDVSDAPPRREGVEPVAESPPSRKRGGRGSIWDCPACCSQMFSGVRCLVHNPPLPSGAGP